MAGTDHTISWFTLPGEESAPEKVPVKRLAVPVNIQNLHWLLVVIDFSTQEVVTYDSSGSGNLSMADSMIQKAKKLCELRKLPFSLEGWTVENKQCEKQTDGHNCGLFTLKFLDCVVEGRSPSGPLFPRGPDVARRQLAEDIMKHNVEHIKKNYL
eukprot:Rmarinus@m.2196